MRHNLERNGDSGLEDLALDDPGLEDLALDDPGLVDPGLVDPGLVDPGLVDLRMSDLWDYRRAWCVRHSLSAPEGWPDLEEDIFLQDM